jgi:hypothetical protein
MKTAISSRWAPGHRTRIDTDAGTFEEVNSPLASSTEADVQSALLSRKPSGYPWKWWAIVIVCAAFAVVQIFAEVQP